MSDIRAGIGGPDTGADPPCSARPFVVRLESGGGLRYGLAVPGYEDAILLLVAHGSTVNADSAAAAQQHAETLRARGLFAHVLVAFWKQEPFIRTVAAEMRTSMYPLAGQRAFVVPLFLSDGYFTRQIIPRELGLANAGEDIPRVQQDGRLTWIYCPPFGTHPRMTELILSRAAEILAGSGAPPPPPDETALLLAAHGTEKNSQSREAAEWQASIIRARGCYAETHAVFMEEKPRISDCMQLVASKNIVVVPFFISDGLHSREDVPVLLGEDPMIVQERLRRGEPPWQNPTERNGRRVWYSGSIGTSPLVADLVLERVREGASALLDIQ